MFKNLFVTTMLVAVSSICLASVPNNQKANNDNAVAVVKNEIAGYKNLTKLQKAQMLVSHKSVEAETRIRREAYLNHNTKDIKTVVPTGNKAKSVNAVPLNSKSVFLKEATKPGSKDVMTSELSFKERLQAKFGIDLTKPRINKYFKKGPKSSNNLKSKQTDEVKVKPVTKLVAKKADTKVIDNSKIKKLQKELQAAKVREAQLQKENNVMKTELKKSISVMQRLKQEKK